MNKPFLKIALMFGLSVAITSSVVAESVSNQSIQFNNPCYQGPDLNARLQTVEQRISSLKQTITTKPQFKQHRGALSTIENKKNSLKADIKAKKNAGQIENELKTLEEKVDALESQLK